MGDEFPPMEGFLPCRKLITNLGWSLYISKWEINFLHLKLVEFRKIWKYQTYKLSKRTSVFIKCWNRTGGNLNEPLSSHDVITWRQADPMGLDHRAGLTPGHSGWWPDPTGLAHGHRVLMAWSYGSSPWTQRIDGLTGLAEGHRGLIIRSYRSSPWTQWTQRIDGLIL